MPRLSPLCRYERSPVVRAIPRLLPPINPVPPPTIFVQRRKSKVIVRRIVLLYAFIPLVILLASVKVSSAQEIVLYASQAPVKVGNWSSVGDSSAAGGARLNNTVFVAGKVTMQVQFPEYYDEIS